MMCRCKHPMIKCGGTGCRCEVCGGLEPIPDELLKQMTYRPYWQAPKVVDRGNPRVEEIRGWADAFDQLAADYMREVEALQEDPRGLTVAGFKTIEASAGALQYAAGYIRDRLAEWARDAE